MEGWGGGSSCPEVLSSRGPESPRARASAAQQNSAPRVVLLLPGCVAWAGHATSLTRCVSSVQCGQCVSFTGGSVWHGIGGDRPSESGQGHPGVAAKAVSPPRGSCPSLCSQTVPAADQPGIYGEGLGGQLRILPGPTSLPRELLRRPRRLWASPSPPPAHGPRWPAPGRPCRLSPRAPRGTRSSPMG
ncbi:protein tyrosine phosphatase type IVA 3 isoform X1 [Canis lupus familiaris]|uniref:protein tyrosine phosphatase type IVA 3 isoform X1 n=1 Tax=Canis lupus dingo TaxID=286419 RepID=UPI0006B3C2AC|nr:protein tyrosine phosphatase type IVA 3 isoform X1 [Canis lupus dingo]XP_038411579.1 protein tyrosine phosphatase type IVA 3 isoform X1 [Canis lupus familiaris]XP_038541083.1 protein tyrosine phosphatase type IVA 3 isoform X1 [Canis lupus familiaris]XP_038547321.1 protein tyrosine phosphatase type IVA 3 isoform X1 [Canis lupus familiaris]